MLLDLKLPKVDGLEVLRRMRADARTQLLPVVVLTLSNEEQDIVEAYRLGVNSYVRKPVDFDRFNELLQHSGRYWLEFNEPPTRRARRRRRASLTPAMTRARFRRVATRPVVCAEQHAHVGHARAPRL